ncbi:hypothetical protein B0H14DRAFT_2622543 [Mycena olivaceomarginata]|nr:hypothetical protein B0H14DRAFT_2622543 [Mycena olivaceomarginata]
MPNGTPLPPVTTPDLPPVLRQRHVRPGRRRILWLQPILGLDLSGVLVDVGLSCSPITSSGTTGKASTPFSTTHRTHPFHSGGTTVTCDAPEKEWGGLIAINCIPVTL